MLSLRETGHTETVPALALGRVGRLPRASGLGDLTAPKKGPFKL